MEGDDTTPVDNTPTVGQHLATFGHEGRLWEVYLELEDETPDATMCRGRFRFDPADANEGEAPVRTATIIIERSFDEAMRRAKSFPDHQLSALLRSARPDAE